MTAILPARIHTAEQLSAQLAELFFQGGWSRHRLAEAAGLSPATVQALLNGSTGIPRTGTLVAFVTACGQDPDPWLQARGHVVRAHGKNRPSRSELETELAARAEAALQEIREATGRPLGTPVRELTDADALHLEVHHAVAAGGRNQVPVLPLYLHRPEVDERLREEVALAEAESRMIEVVGDSSTGKTRACWEAVRAELPDWRIWHPLTPDRAPALLEGLRGGLVAPRTVIWLNEAQFYLDAGGAGEQVAAALQELLADAERCPVLILGSMWPDSWRQLTTLPDVISDLRHGDGAVEHDPRRAARTLLGRAIDITMPRHFTHQHIAAARETIASDPRLVLAVQSAGGQITQFLAGAPDLLRRYQHAGPAAKAVLHAAIDILRLGHSRYLPEPMLAEAATGYIEQHDWDQLDDDWYITALDDLTASRRRMPGPLIPHRPRPGDPPTAHRLYRLADFLEQHGGIDRQYITPPATVWTAARHARQPRDLFRLAHAAFVCGEYQRAVPLFEHAVAVGEGEAVGYLSWLLEQNGESAQAGALALQQANDADLPDYLRTSALKGLGLLRESQGCSADAERLALQAAEAGDTDVLRQLVWARDQAGHHDRAEQLAGYLPDLGASTADSHTLRNLARERTTRRDQQGAERMSALADEADHRMAKRLARVEVLSGEAWSVELYKMLWRPEHGKHSDHDDQDESSSRRG
jgi:transcriptional regulator with XRE-family HTH domain/tetratricopeptide (TPR) repeat protein